MVPESWFAEKPFTIPYDIVFLDTVEEGADYTETVENSNLC